MNNRFWHPSPEIMLTDNPLRSILTFGMPIVIGNIFQQLYSMVDTIVVGKYVGVNALAAVGSSATVCQMLVMACFGLSSGAGVVIAQFFGAGRRREINTTISTTLIFAVFLSIVLSIAAWPLFPGIGRLIHIPEEILSDAVLYMRIYSAGLVFLMLYNFYANILRSLGDSVTPLIFLIISSLLNIAGDLWFVIGFGLGVAGVALATVLSQAVSVILCIFYAGRKIEFFRFAKGEFRFSKELFGLVLKTGIPAMIQSAVNNLGFIIVQSLINSFGAVNIAAYTAANKMEMLSMLPVIGVTSAFAVFAGQNIGAQDIERTKQGMRSTIRFLLAVCVIMSSVMFAVGPKLIGLFVDSSEAVVISRGTAYMRTFCPFLILFALMNVYTSLLRGAGDSVMAMLCSMTDLMMRLTAAYVLSLLFGIGFMGCAIAIPIGWGSAAFVSWLRARSGKWMEKELIGK